MSSLIQYNKINETLHLNFNKNLNVDSDRYNSASPFPHILLKSLIDDDFLQDVTKEVNSYNPETMPN